MAEEVEVHPEKIREFIGYVLGFADIVGEIPEFLEGKDGGQSVWLSRRDLGDIPHFYNSWNRICGWRHDEAIELQKVLRDTAERLTQGLAAFTQTDEQISATFPKIGDSSLTKELEEKGLVVDGAPSKTGAYVPGSVTGPS